MSQPGQNAAGDLTVQFEHRIKLIEEGLTSLKNVFLTSWNSRLESSEQNISRLNSRFDKLVGDILEDRDMFQNLHAEVQTLKQDFWWEQGVGETSPQKGGSRRQTELHPKELRSFVCFMMRKVMQRRSKIRIKRPTLTVRPVEAEMILNLSFYVLRICITSRYPPFLVMQVLSGNGRTL